jgi:predicted ArsR family transcriptional regulator
LQRRIVDYLAAQDDWWSCSGIATELDADPRAVRRALPRLVADGAVERMDWGHLRYYGRPRTDDERRADAKVAERARQHVAADAAALAGVQLVST